MLCGFSNDMPSDSHYTVTKIAGSINSVDNWYATRSTLLAVSETPHADASCSRPPLSRAFAGTSCRTSPWRTMM